MKMISIKKLACDLDVKTTITAVSFSVSIYSI